MKYLISQTLSVTLAALCCMSVIAPVAYADDYDLVILGGRVMGP
jgi:hypothetical protein